MRHLCEFWMVEPEFAWADINEDMYANEIVFHLPCR